ncbi:uncharacterized protein GIQ15_06843 [Arthroderma uncinatum]|uniref:uncharacterized protein n=1 Tax=Arthroderma uncinatum TaxID=74035 RepID=UPI00144AAB00|nr:uncharacterized protein GIQ15_06843 [Arthroderma uncinatum]KAF3479867.1 hypothetical protein GIQ15_06843 [Arthroderma uncinatum]
MAFRGERFHLDLSDDDEPDNVATTTTATAMPSLGSFVNDIQERTPSAPTPPTAPTPKSTPTTTGFPAHRKRTKVSAFRRQRENAGVDTDDDKPAAKDNVSTEVDEKRAIDEENRRRLEAMSKAEIEAERAELRAALPTSLIERLLRRANIEEDQQVSQGAKQDDVKELESSPTASLKEPPKKSVSFDIPTKQATLEEVKDDDKEQTYIQPDDLPPANPPSGLHPASQPPPPIHFPRPPPRSTPMPNLDPSSPSFLADLQTHYFPDTPHSSSSLSWLRPSDSDSDPSSAYHPSSTATSIAPASIRFSLTGTILPPRTALSLPPSMGLHHHAADPEAAGYTVPELAILSRSTVPAQRCLAWQVLGRVLYRLGKGEWGDQDSQLVSGLWSVVERESVVAGMIDEAGGDADIDGKKETSDDDKLTPTPAKAGGIGRHASARAWATEAVWLWRRGGDGTRGLRREAGAV